MNGFERRSFVCKGDGMRKTLLTIFILMLTASVAFAQPGRLGIYADPLGTNCTITDALALVPVYVIHIETSGAAAGQYQAPTPACWTGATFLADAAAGPAVGGSHTGSHAVGYGGCLSSPIVVNTMSFFGSGLATACCLYEVQEDAITGVIEMVDCSSVKVTIAGKPGVVSGSGGGAPCDCNTVTPTESRTWGGVKALYSSE
jgi:hypothetical protein